jgi:hypothetical protein
MATKTQILANRIALYAIRNTGYYRLSTSPHMQKVLEIRSIDMFLCASVPLWL